MIADRPCQLCEHLRVDAAPQPRPFRWLHPGQRVHHFEPTPTVREAADKDYRITVLSDGCADADEEVHRVLTTKVFPRQADVMTVDEWGGR